MPDMNEVIEQREISISCWHCKWTEARSLHWLSSQRHMNCPNCCSVIVLDSGEVRREIARQRRQLSALQSQMVNLLQSAGKIARPQTPPRITGVQPTMDLALARSHPLTLRPSVRSTAATRRQHR